MRTIEIDRVLPAPIEPFFEAMADHARYDRFKPIDSAELVREGADDPNGTGALRRLRSGPFRFDEEITAFERPTRFDYLIVDVSIPFHHEGGSIRFEPAEVGTRVTWTTTFTVGIPVLSVALDRVVESMLRRSFHQILDGAAEAANATTPSRA